MELTQKFWDNM